MATWNNTESASKRVVSNYCIDTDLCSGVRFATVYLVYHLAWYWIKNDSFLAFLCNRNLCFGKCIGPKHLLHGDGIQRKYKEKRNNALAIEESWVWLFHQRCCCSQTSNNQFCLPLDAAFMAWCKEDSVRYWSSVPNPHLVLCVLHHGMHRSTNCAHFCYDRWSSIERDHDWPSLDHTNHLYNTYLSDTSRHFAACFLSKQADPIPNEKTHGTEKELLADL